MTETNDDIWIKRAQDAYTGSTSYFDANVRSSIEANLRLVQGKHPANSKYYSDVYKSRSKLFRPKTRAMTRKNEAICAAAFFSNEDAMKITAEDDSNPQSQASAEMMQELIQYRLTHSIQWFLTVLGAYQDAMVNGVVASYQYWHFNAKKKIDKPCIELMPVENLRFDPAANWTDPINSSPYVIRLIPMYVKDVRSRMNNLDTKTGEPKWNKLTDAQILTASKQTTDSIRLQREGNRVDPKDQTASLSEYQIVWVHQNFIETDDGDFVYYTLGIEHMLSKPVAIDKMYAHGKRPIVLGCAVVDAHKTYPDAAVHLTRDTQNEINEIANQRIDNVKMAMNKRYFAKRNAQVDIRSLTRNVPSSVTLMNDVDSDVKVLETQDVTSSSYKEHEMLNNDFDDLAGSFSQSSVQSNRNLNETVGGMEMLSDSANQISEYQLRTFVETWAEPVLRQLVMLEQKYETDENILIFAGKKADLVIKYGISEITDSLIEQELVVNVNVGLGSTNPQAHFERFVKGLTTLDQLFSSQIGTKLDEEEVTKEVMGKLGYKDGKRFFLPQDDPKITSLMDKINTLQQALDAKTPPELLAAQVAKLTAEAEGVKAKTVDTNVTSQFGAMQAAQVVATVQGVAPVADEILKGAGFVPKAGDGTIDGIPNNPDVFNQPQAPMMPDENEDLPVPMGDEAETMDIPKNTSPLFPAKPASPNAGFNQGIETIESD